MGREKGVREAQSTAAQGELSQREDLVLMSLAPGERFYKFYILTEPANSARGQVEHRIITKEHADGSLEMVSYNAWVADGHSEKRDVIRVPSLPKALLERIVRRVREQSDLPPEAIREIDLSRCETVEDQLRVLARLGP